MKTCQNIEEIQRKDNLPRFDGLDPHTMYTIHIATELEGKTVVQVTKLFSLINDYTLFIFLPEITSEVENKLLMIYQTLSYSRAEQQQLNV